MFSVKNKFPNATELCTKSDNSELSTSHFDLLNAQVFDFGSVGDIKLGYLTVAQSNNNLPFEIKRVYWTYNTPNDVIRGNHAHRKLKQVIFAVSGEIEIEIEAPNREKTIYKLSSPHLGLYVPELHWRTLKFGVGAVLLSLASLDYDADEYIRDYNEFVEMCSK